MIGRSNARRGARRIFNVMQNRRLNQHIVYLVIDEVRVCCVLCGSGREPVMPLRQIRMNERRMLISLGCDAFQVFSALFPDAKES